MTALFEYSSISENVDRSEITDMLPHWKTMILEALYIDQETFPKLQLKFLIEANNIETVQKWISELEDCAKTKYSIRSTEKSNGRYVEFKQRLVCHHCTGHTNVYDSTKHSRQNTKNTNCPSKLTITLHAVKERYRGKDIQKHEFLKMMPCEVLYVVSHNHTIGTADSLRFRKVSDEVKLQLIELYHNGHSPGTALESIKLDIQLNNDNYEILLADRKFCPTYYDCYTLYIKEFKKVYRSPPFDKSRQDYLLQKIESFNAEMKDSNSARMINQGTSYAICICPPLFKRVHQNIKESSELVFMDSIGTVDRDGSRLFILLTHSECGRLPLGILITSSDDTAILSKGLELLKEMIGSDLFYGNSDGPVAFITDDSSSEQLALNLVWPISKHFLCIFHVLQSVWRWIIRGKNNIPKEKQIEFFNDFKNIMYSNTIEECESNYAIAVSNADANYLEYLNEYWKKRELWAKPFRNVLLLRGNHNNNYSELRVIKGKILERVKAFNVVQMVDFFFTKFIKYYERRLLDAAHNRNCQILKENIPVPPPGILEKILLNGNMALVPSERNENLNYTVNMEINFCGCFRGTTGSYCKHFYWASIISPPRKIETTIDNLQLRPIYYKIATGENSQGDWLKPFSKQIDSTNSEMPVSNENENFTENCRDIQNLPDMRIENSENDIDVYFGAIEKLQNYFKEFLMKSPSEVGPSILRLCETVEKIKTPSTFASYNFSYGRGSDRVNRNEHNFVQSTALSRRKTQVSGKKAHVGGRFRKLVSVSGNSIKRKRNVGDTI